ncbi:MAG TPA: AsmA-like C-terminal region-containing protein [Terrimicrobiaceae bacterium]|nr:AsmA-like C-terminal region-containing protein [Terrimicrobiaceae bacterium]
MSKFAKRFLFFAVAALVTTAIILLCVNIYLQSAGVQERIRAAAARSLGTDLKIGSTIYTPWDGLVLRGLRIADPSVSGEAIVEAAALRIRFAMFPLFQRRFVVKELALFEPKLIVRQMENGEWLVPIPPARTPYIAIPPAGTAEVPPVPSARPASFKAELQRFRIGGGTILFLDAKNRPVLKLEKSNIDTRISSGLSATGTYRIGEMDFASALHPRKIEGTFVWNGATLELPDISGDLAGGEISGSFRLENGSDPTFALGLQFAGVQLKRLALESKIDSSKTDGTLIGSITLAGDPRNSDSLAGKGHLELIEARLKPVDFLSKLGELLRIEELQLLRLSEAKIDLTIADKKVNVDGIFLKSENIILAGSGPVRFDGKMNIDARLLVNARLQQQLKGLLGKNFVPAEDPEYRQLPFSVTGKLSSPKTDLLDKIIGINIGQDVGGLLKNLFRAPAPPKSADDQPKAPVEN